MYKAQLLSKHHSMLFNYFIEVLMHKTGLFKMILSVNTTVIS